METNHPQNYGIDRWSDGYFAINTSGHVVVRPFRNQQEGDLYQLMASLVEQGIEAPILIRFDQIINDRIDVIHAAFEKAISDANYCNIHQMVFPIKVNPQRHVVETVIRSGQKYRMGLEVGSKPELIAILALKSHSEMLLMCNGYKDAEYISLALMANKLGRQTLITIEQPYELKIVFELAEKLGVEPKIGFRMKLSDVGSGRWKSSGGEHSKFGLFSYEILACLEQLKKKEKTHWLKLLHFHLGSQITTIEAIQRALLEAARMYTELAAIAPSLCYFDIGGGLAIDYSGLKDDSNYTMNYTIDEYAQNAVSIIGKACLAAGIPDPIIVTESGRALVAHHSVLITEVIDVTATPELHLEIASNSHEILKTFSHLEESLSGENCREVLHDIIELREKGLNEFLAGTMSLHERAYAEKKARSLLARIHTLYQEQFSHTSNEFLLLNKAVQEIYFCNFSVFQSLPDAWAIDQLFPVMPIHRLNTQPTHRAILSDLTCDSDGTIDEFLEEDRTKSFLKLHTYHNEPYYIAIFLTGAYQEILGGLHNLFGDTNVAHANLDEEKNWRLSHLVEGDTIEEVLAYVQYSVEMLLIQLYELIEMALKEKKISLAESASIKKKFKEALNSYTYLVV